MARGLKPTYNYPSNEQLVELIEHHRNLQEVARQIDIPYQALWRYISRRPALKAETAKFIKMAGAPLRHAYPPDEEIVRMVEKHGSLNAVARELDIESELLRGYVQRRPELKANVYSLLPERHRYPSDKELNDLMEGLGSYSKVAQHLGVRRESLRDYVRRRPVLAQALFEINQHVQARPPDEHRKRPSNISSSVAHLYNDPCAYCGGNGGTVDHIEAIANGGALGSDNLTACCHSCNAAKGNRFSLLEFLVYRRS